MSSHVRPSVIIAEEGHTGLVFFDSGARRTIASYDLYQKLLKERKQFKEETCTIKLADGSSRQQNILKTHSIVLESTS